MGTLAEQKPSVQDAPAEETTDESVDEKQEGQETTSNVVEDSTGKEEAPEDIQTIQTTKLLARGDLVQKVDGPVALEIRPLEMQEVYSLDVFDATGHSVYSVNAHSGVFKKTLDLPAGKYKYLLKTKHNEMPFTVVFDRQGSTDGE